MVAYRRVSTGAQEISGLGLEAQQVLIEAEVSRRKWHLVETYTDTGSGGSMRGRPGLQEALERLDRGEADVLLAAKLDRLSRSTKDFVELLDRAGRRHWHLLALDAPADTTSPQGEALASMLAIFSQLERRLIGLRTQEALAALKARGVRLGRPRLLSDDIRSRIVVSRRNGLTLAGIADQLNSEVIPTACGGVWFAASVQRALRSAALDGEAA